MGEGEFDKTGARLDRAQQVGKQPMKEWRRRGHQDDSRDENAKQDKQRPIGRY
jgi:hypothetical protein